MLISAVQQSGSVICMYTFFFILFSIVVYPIYTSLHLLIPDSQSDPLPAPSSLATTSLFSMFLMLFHR